MSESGVMSCTSHKLMQWLCLLSEVIIRPQCMSEAYLKPQECTLIPWRYVQNCVPHVLCMPDEPIHGLPLIDARGLQRADQGHDMMHSHSDGSPDPSLGVK